MPCRVAEMTEEISKKVRTIMATRELELMFSDLTESAKKEFLELHQIDSAADGNFDLQPIVVLQSEE